MQVVRDAVEWVRARPEVRPSHVGLFGVSLGAFVSVGAAATIPHVTRVVLLSGGLDPGVADSTGHFPPALLLHGTDDSEVPLADEDALLQVLRRHHALILTHRYPGEGHDFSEEAAIDAVERAARFLKEGLIGTLLDVMRRSASRPAAADTTRPRVP